MFNHLIVILANATDVQNNVTKLNFFTDCELF